MDCSGSTADSPGSYPGARDYDAYEDDEYDDESDDEYDDEGPSASRQSGGAGTWMDEGGASGVSRAQRRRVSVQRKAPSGQGAPGSTGEVTCTLTAALDSGSLSGGGAGPAGSSAAGASSSGATATAPAGAAQALACAHCGKAPGGPEGVKLKRCSGCRRVRFCSPACLKAAWKAGHKAECGQAPSQAAPAAGSS